MKKVILRTYDPTTDDLQEDFRMEIPYENFSEEKGGIFHEKINEIVEVEAFYENPIYGIETAFKECFDMVVSKENIKPFWKSLISRKGIEFYEFEIDGYENQKYIPKEGCELKTLNGWYGHSYYQINRHYSEAFDKNKTYLKFHSGIILKELWYKDYYCYMVEETYTVANEKGEEMNIDGYVKTAKQFYVIQNQFNENRVIVNNENEKDN